MEVVEPQALQDQAQRLVEAAGTDPLTGVGNRSLCDEAARGLAVDSDESVFCACAALKAQGGLESVTALDRCPGLRLLPHR